MILYLSFSSYMARLFNYNSLHAVHGDCFLAWHAEKRYNCQLRSRRSGDHLNLVNRANQP